jgi:hypothetical protein
MIDLVSDVASRHFLAKEVSDARNLNSMLKNHLRID